MDEGPGSRSSSGKALGRPWEGEWGPIGQRGSLHTQLSLRFAKGQKEIPKGSSWMRR